MLSSTSPLMNLPRNQFVQKGSRRWMMRCPLMPSFMLGFGSGIPLLLWARTGTRPVLCTACSTSTTARISFGHLGGAGAAPTPHPATTRRHLQAGLNSMAQTSTGQDHGGHALLFKLLRIATFSSLRSHQALFQLPAAMPPSASMGITCSQNSPIRSASMPPSAAGSAMPFTHSSEQSCCILAAAERLFVLPRPFAARSLQSLQTTENCLDFHASVTSSSLSLSSFLSASFFVLRHSRDALTSSIETSPSSSIASLSSLRFLSSFILCSMAAFRSLLASPLSLPKNSFAVALTASMSSLHFSSAVPPTKPVTLCSTASTNSFLFTPLRHPAASLSKSQPSSSSFARKPSVNS
mmetsp:Transcript_52143/g.148656  ORF Transcript_52143/g.148656 Transcript_52143/m.148656 type:complete len:352 (-) Transcript_52143:40-1095(-)